MKARLFDFDKDQEMITEWHRGWGMTPIPREMLPTYGVIASNEGCDIGALWIYLTDGHIGLIEGAILNPKAPKKLRKGIHSFLAEVIIRIATEAGCVQVWALSSDKFLVSICNKLGFSALTKDYKLLIKRL